MKDSPRSLIGRSLGILPNRHHKQKQRQETLWFILLTLPALGLLALFVYWPIVFTFFLSFTDWNMISPEKTFVGLKNYQDLFQSSLFYKVVGNTFVFAFFTVFVRIALSLGLAVLLFRNTRFQTLFRTLIFLPHITTTAVAAVVWLFILDPHYGLSKVVFDLFGAAAPVWVSDAKWAMPAIVLVSIWKSLGFSTVIYLAALGGLDESVQEAARVDGASEWQVFCKITLPMLSPITLFLAVTGVLTAIQTFDIPAIMTQGGPFNTTTTYVLYLYDLAFQRFRTGQASAFACVFFLIMLLLTFLNMRLSKRWVHQ